MGGNDSHEYRQQATQGLLYMIDTAPKPPSDSQQQLTMVQEHLREHAYYKLQWGEEKQTVLRTEHDCVQLLRELASESRLNRMKQAKETLVDVIFRVGSSKVSETLLTRYHYDHATFDPTSLPGPPLDTNHLGGPPPKKKKGQSMSSRSEAPPSDDNDVTSDDTGDEDFTAPVSFHNEHHALFSMPVVTAHQHAIWTLLQDIDAAIHLADHAEWKYRDSITRTASLELLIQQFSLLYRWNGVIYPYTAETLHHSLRDKFKARKLPELRQTPFSQIYKLGSKALAPQYVHQLKKSYEMVINATNRPRYSSMPKFLTSTEVFAELNSANEKSIRVHEDDQGKNDPQSDKSIDHTSRSSSLTEASWHDAESTGTSSQSSGLDVNLRKSTTTRSPSTTTPLHRPTPSPLTTPAAFSPKPMLSNLAAWEKDFSDLSERISRAVSSLFTNLNLPFSQTSPYLPASSPSLRPVFEACFGDDFQSACIKFRDSDNFSAFNVTQYLIAAFIQEHLLKETLDWQRTLCIQLGWSKIEDVQRLFTMLRDPLQNAVAREKHLPRRFAQAILKSVDDDHDRVVLAQFTHQAANQLTADLTPYIEVLWQIAMLLNQEEIHTEETWRDEFEGNIAAIVTGAADLKLRLNSSELEHCFFLPSTGKQFDEDTHKAIGASDSSVAFTLMPGLRLVEGGSTAVLPAHVVCHPGEEGENT